MDRARLCRQRLHNRRVCQVERLHLKEVAAAEASPEPLGEIRSEEFDQLFTVSGARVTALFLLDDTLTEPQYAAVIAAFTARADSRRPASRRETMSPSTAS
jgi:hypothetical protein